MTEINFSADERNEIVEKIKQYFIDELDQDIAQFDAEFLLTFFSKQIGPYFYNRGLFDAKALIENKVELITESIYDIEKPIG